MIVLFFNDTATTEIYTLSLHDALPISVPLGGRGGVEALAAVDHADPAQPVVDGDLDLVLGVLPGVLDDVGAGDRKSTRLNSSHANISYAVFCLKKKKNSAHRAFRRHCL